MIRDLMYKEMHLNLPIALLAFLVMPLLLLIPVWPHILAFAYFGLVLMTIGQADKANADLLFVGLLPVRKRDVITARTLHIVGWEVAFILVGAVAAIIHYHLVSTDNLAGMNPNMAFFGIVFLMYAIFNLIYLSGAYKRAYRMLWPMLGGMIIAALIAGSLSVLPQLVPALTRLFNDRGLGNWGYQLAVLLVGMMAFVLATLWGRKKAIIDFEAVDL